MRKQEVILHEIWRWNVYCLMQDNIEEELESLAMSVCRTTLKYKTWLATNTMLRKIENQCWKRKHTKATMKVARFRLSNNVAIVVGELGNVGLGRTCVLNIIEKESQIVFTLGPQNSHVEEISTRRHGSNKIFEGSRWPLM